MMSIPYGEARGGRGQARSGWLIDREFTSRLDGERNHTRQLWTETRCRTTIDPTTSMKSVITTMPGSGIVGMAGGEKENFCTRKMLESAT